jgi:hypothetical protein
MLGGPLQLLEPLGDEVDVVLETSHDCAAGHHDDLYREHIDLPILKSILYDYEELLTHDGCTGIAVLNPHIPLEVQFDEHKLLIAYGQNLSEFEEVLQSHGIRCNVVAPGSTDTPMLTSMWADAAGRTATLEGAPEEFRVGIPLGKLAQPAHVAHAVDILLSDRASHITLHDQTVDGGAALGV